jgi:hypothetical protein
MPEDREHPDQGDFPANDAWKSHSRAALQVIGGAVPLFGGFLSAAASQWSEKEQQRVNDFIRAWLKLLEDEIKEKGETIIEITSRLNLQDEKIAMRVRSDEYQSLLKKAFRNWAGTESLRKRELVRNILSNAAASSLVSDDVVRLFIDWLHTYSEFHFIVIADIYNNPSATRADIWERTGKEQPREDSAEADLFKLLFRDLSTGGVIRQHRETDYHGNFLKKATQNPTNRRNVDRRMKSAFDDTESYELTALGQQFVHYAMTEVTTRIEYHPNSGESDASQS